MYQYTYTKDIINLHVFKFKENIPKDEFEKFKIDFKNLLDKRETFYVVFDLLNISNFDIKFFYKKMDYIYSNKEIVKKYLKASSIVIKKFYGDLIKVGLKIKKPLSLNTVVEDMNSGVQFLIDSFQKIEDNNLKEN